MRLTLTYEGPLPARQRGVSPVKAQLRRAFHPQIRDQIKRRLGEPSLPHVSTAIGGHQFISAAHPKMGTVVDLDVLMMVPHGRRPTGDPDNRLKTLIDGLTRPANIEQMQDFAGPEDGGPTYCLMDEDRLVRQLTVDIRPWFKPEQPFRNALVVVTASMAMGDHADMSSPVSSMFLVL